MKPSFFATTRLMLRGLLRPTTPMARKTKLQLGNLEAREQTGNMVNGLFAAAAGGAMLEPQQAMAALVGDPTAFLTPPSQPTPIASPSHQPETSARLLALPSNSVPDTAKSSSDIANAINDSFSLSFDPTNAGELDLGLSLSDAFQLPPTSINSNSGGGSGGNASGSHGTTPPSDNANQRGGGASGERESSPDQSFASNSNASNANTSVNQQSRGAVAKNRGAKGQAANLEQFLTPPSDSPTPEAPAARMSGPVARATAVDPLVAIATDAGTNPRVKVYDVTTQNLKFTLQPYPNSFDGGVRVAVADVDGDSTPDIITAQGQGGNNRVKVFSGVDGTQFSSAIGSFVPFSTNNVDGLYVAAADVTGDGKAEIIVGTDDAATPRVRVYNGANGNLLKTVDLSTMRFAGGVRVAAGDINGDGKADVVASGGEGGSSRVVVFDGQNGKEIQNFFAFDANARHGVNIAVGDVNADGYDDIITGQATGGSLVRVYNGYDNTYLRAYEAFTGSTGGIRVGAADADMDGRVDVLVGEGDGGGQTTILAATNGDDLRTWSPFGNAFAQGTFVAGDARPAEGGGISLFSDPPEVWVVSYTPSVVEGGTGEIVFARSGDTSAVLWASFSYIGGTANGAPSGEYRIGNYGTIEFGIGESTDTQTVTVYEDSVPEGIETAIIEVIDYEPYYVAGSPAQARFTFPDNDGPSIDNPPPNDCGCGNPDLAQQAAGVSADVGNAAANSGVRAADGAHTTSIPSISSSGFGQTYGTATVWTNQPGYDAVGYDGNNVVAVGLPYLTQHGDDIAVITGGQQGQIFDGAGTNTNRHFSQDILTYAYGSGSGTGSGSSSGSGSGTGEESGSGSGTGGESGSGSGTGEESGSGSGTGTGEESGSGSGSGTGEESGSGSGTGTGTGTGSGSGGISGEYTLVTSAGSVLTFNDFDSSLPAAQRGQVKKMTDPQGNVTEIISVTVDGKPEEVQRSSTVGGVTTLESYLYAYLTSGTNAGKIESVTLRRKVGAGSWTTVRVAEYTYHGTGSSTGTAGDIKTAIVEDGSSNVLENSYFRYYTSASGIGYAGGLKYVVTGSSYERFLTWCNANSTTPEAADDADVAVFADQYFEYDNVRRVTKHTKQGEGCSACSGGLATNTFSYEISGFANGYNNWLTKTVETLADGNTNTIYANFAGQPILTVFKDTTTNQEWCNYFRYDNDGRLVLTAQPSAISGYDEDTADLLNNQSGDYVYLRDEQGLIATTTYGTSTTATSSTAGDVEGYTKATFVQRGEDGTAIKQSETQYLSRTDGTLTVYPVATTTQFRNTNGTGGQTTTYAYTWFSGTIQAESITTTLPTVTTGQNGSNTAETSTVVMDDRGRGVWTKDGGGFINYTEFDDVTGGVTKTIRDVDTTQTGTFTNLPSGWTTPSGGGLHQTTTYELDDQGRQIKETDPNGLITYTVFNDVTDEVRTYSGWDTTSNLPTGPTTVSRTDEARGYTETLTMSATPNVSSGRPTGTESISGVLTLSRTILNDAGQAVYSDQYFNLTGVTYSQSSVTLGTLNTNYYRTETVYDQRGRVSKTISPSGTIYRTEFDGLGRTVSTWVGTDDTPTTGFWSPTNLTGTNMVKLNENEYDAGGVGDSNLTKSTAIPGGSEANRVSAMSYDWRNRMVASKSGVEGSESTSVNRPISYTEYDNLSQAIVSESYDGDGLSITTDANADGVPDRPSSSALRSKSTADYDEQGRTYKSSTFSVNPTNGNVSTDALVSMQWYNTRGMVMKSSSPGGTISKSQFDGLGRTTKSFITDGGGDSGYSDADDVTGDNVLSQTEMSCDIGGRTLMVTSKERFHDETTTGELGNASTAPKARVSYSTSYYDKGNRTTSSVNVGTNGGIAYTRPGTVPSRSDTVLVTDYGYNASGWLETTTDPKGLIGKQYYDHMGRTIKTIENYVDGTVGDDNDKTVEYTYDANGQMSTLKAMLTSGYQETKWIYGITSPIYSNDVLLEMRYPDTSSGNASSSEKDAFTYNNLGEVLTKTDRNGNVHTFARDILGRQTIDAVTTLGSGVDGSIRRVETNYDTQGNIYQITTFDAATAGNVVNQIQRGYNGLSQMTVEYQAVNGSVNTSTTPKVQYGYSEMASSANHSRLNTITYPNGRVLTYNYASGLDNNISRLSSISDGGTTLESYDYLGYGTVVSRKHAEPGVDLTYIKLSGESDGAAGDKYNGLDFLGRVIDQRWTTSGGTTKDRFAYGYDRDSNPLYKENFIDTTRSELFDYDGLNQLTTFSRGTLNGGKTAISGAASRTQSWDFDGLGNFDDQSTNGTSATRTYNKQNEITSATGQTTPTYDNNGNQTKDLSDRRFKFDAWNRLVEVQPADGGSAIRTYEYDGLNRRIQENASGTTTDFYYSSSWQVLEERVGGNATVSYVWSPIYVDAMIARDRDTDANGSLDERLYPTHDLNFNITAVVNTSGTVVERFANDPYGSPTFFDASYGTRSSSNYNWTHLHQGLRWDNGTGKYWNRRRDFDPVQGRFTSNDPIGVQASDINLYRALDNSPLLLNDPTGEQSKKDPTPAPKPVPYEGKLEALFGKMNSLVCITKAAPDEDTNPLIRKGRFGACEKFTTDVVSWEDMLNKWFDRNDLTLKDIKALAIVGHGAGIEGGGVLGSKDKDGKRLTALTSASLTAEQVQILDNLLPKDCVIVIAACQQGNQEKGMQALANKLKRKIIAPNCDCGGTKGFDLSDKDPKKKLAWLEFTPQKSKD